METVAKTSVEGPSANAPVDNPSASQRVCSAEWPLSGEPIKESIFFLNRFQTLNRHLSNTKFRAKASSTENTPQNNQALMGT
jgi:hypothetical protein